MDPRELSLAQAALEDWLDQEGWRLAKRELTRRIEELSRRLLLVDPNDAAAIARLQGEAQAYGRMLNDPAEFFRPG